MENLESLYKKAVWIAQEAHKGQTDKGGNPYIEHPLYVASQVDTTELKIVAVLHDTLEDSDVTAEDLRREGFPEHVVEAITVLTHEDGNEEAYLDYIRRVSGNAMAAAVKRADLLHNMDISRIPNPTEKDKKRRAKYERAYLLLEELTQPEQETP